jgi:hypothetical protein
MQVPKWHSQRLRVHMHSIPTLLCSFFCHGNEHDHFGLLGPGICRQSDPGVQSRPRAPALTHPLLAPLMPLQVYDTRGSGGAAGCATVRLVFSADAAKLLPPALASANEQQQQLDCDGHTPPITIISSEPKWRLDYGQAAALPDVDAAPLPASYLPILDMQWMQLLALEAVEEGANNAAALAVACGGGCMVLDLATAACLQVCGYGSGRVVDHAVVACQVYDETFGILASLPPPSSPLEFFAAHAPKAIR